MSILHRFIKFLHLKFAIALPPRCERLGYGAMRCTSLMSGGVVFYNPSRNWETPYLFLLFKIVDSRQYERLFSALVTLEI